MNRRHLAALTSIVSVTLIIAGCQPQQPIYLREGSNLSQYLDRATQVEYPDVHAQSLEEVTENHQPVTLRHPDFGEFWDLSLEDCVAIALQNSKILRGYGTPGLQGNRVAPGADGLVNNPAGAGTTYNVAIRESEPGSLGFAYQGPRRGINSTAGGLTTNTGLDAAQGVEAALAEFDANFSAVARWDRIDAPTNTVPSLFTDNFSPALRREDTISINSQLSKKSAAGTTFSIRNLNTFSSNNRPSFFSNPTAFQAFDNWWTASVEAEARQPLLRGRGTAINRTPVIMARIGTDQEIADLEAILQNMLCNVEIRYWDLHCAYRAYEAARQGEDSALATWSLVNNKFQAGEGEPNEAAQTREQYFSFRSAKNQALADLLDAETNLRWLMGLANSDKRMVRPVDEPASVLVEYDWWHIYDEALTRRPELRKERWELKKRDLALAYARNGLLPQMDVVALYRVLGLGQKLAGGSSSSPEFPNWGSRAYDQLEDFDYNELSLQLEFGMPVGFRRELANVRNAQLKLAREHARLEDMELDAQRELAMVFRAKDTNYELAQDHANRWVASAEEERIQNARWKEGKTTIDRVLDARRRKAQSQIDYYRSLCEYNKSIALLQRRKGTMLEYCGVEFDEGPWPAKAYSDAADTARRRSATRTLQHGHTRPGVVSHTTMPETDSEGMLMQEGIDVEPGTALELIEPMPLETEIPIPMPQQLELEDQASRLPFPKSLRRRNSIPRADRLVQQASWEEQGGEYAPANDLRTEN